jgi:GNAT superfamily N-acetyltransferase
VRLGFRTVYRTETDRDGILLKRALFAKVWVDKRGVPKDTTVLKFQFSDAANRGVGRAIVDIDEHGAVINWLKVNAAFWRQGLGTQEVFMVEKELQRRGVRKVALVAEHSAIPFWEGLGYKPVPTSNLSGFDHIKTLKRLRV